MMISTLFAILSYQNIGILDARSCANEIQALARIETASDDRLLELVVETYKNAIANMPIEELQQLLADPLIVPQPSQLTSESSHLIILRGLIPLAISKLGSGRIRPILKRLVQNNLDQKKANASTAADLATEKRSSRFSYVKIGRHEGVISLLINSRGTALYSGSTNEIRIWDLESNEQPKVLGPIYPGSEIILNRNDATLVAYSVNAFPIFWNAKTGKPSSQYFPFELFSSLAFSSNGRILFGAKKYQSPGTYTLMWDSIGGEHRRFNTYLGRVTTLAVSADDLDLILVVSYANRSSIRRLRLYGLKPDDYSYMIDELDDSIPKLILNKAESKLISVSIAGQVSVWNAETGEPIIFSNSKNTIRTNHNFPNAVAMSPNGKWLFFSPADNSIMICDIETGKLLEFNDSKIISIKPHQDAITAIVASPDEGFIFSASSSGEIVQTNLHDIIPPEYWERAQ